MTEAVKNLWTGLVVICLALAGWVHLDIVPFHFSHMPAHGIFFATLGLTQLIFIPFFLFLPQNQPIHWLGFTLTGGMVILWGFTQLGVTPFTRAAEPMDTATIISKLAESIGCIALVLRCHAQKFRALSKTFGVSIVNVGMVLAVGFATEALIGGTPGGHHGHEALKGFNDPQNKGHSHTPYANDYTADYDWGDVWSSLKSYLATRSKTTYLWGLPPGFPKPRVPEDNPITAEKVQLGRHLFYDKRLSGNGTLSCASCHHQDKAFADGLERPKGSTGMIHPRNSLTLTNSAYSSTLTWANPSLGTIEKQVLVPMFGEFPVELGITGQEEKVRNRFKNDTLYQQLFSEAFPSEKDPYHFVNFAKALASFTRTMISGNSPYDQYIYQKDTAALTIQELRGLKLFLSEELECHHCHGGFNFTLSTVHDKTVFVEKPFHNTGLYNLDGRGAYPTDNTGVFEFTAKEKDMGKFRAPTLRNIALTAPYMHDGSIATLEEVIDFYERGGRHIEKGKLAGDGKKSPLKSGFVVGFEITGQEKEDLVAFLKALTDEQFVKDTRFSDPFAPPGIARK